MSNFIKIKNVSKKINGHIVLDDISISLDKSKIYGFRGVNGSGKTMLFRALLGLLNLDKGSIEIADKQVTADTKFPVRTGILIEQPSLINEFSAKKNMELLASLLNYTSKDKKTKAIEVALLATGLNINDSRKVSKYSLGMKQRLGLSQAFLGNPELLVLDEPTNALDEDSIIIIKKYLKDCQKNGTTILIASHDRIFLNDICDYTFNIKNGKI